MLVEPIEYGQVKAIHLDVDEIVKNEESSHFCSATFWDVSV